MRFQNYTFGPIWSEEDGGVSFNIYSENASKVEVLLYSHSNQKYPREIYSAKFDGKGLWHIFISGVKPGDLYAYRVYGPYKPEYGLRFNSSKILIDPFARAVSGVIPLSWDNSLFDYRVDSLELGLVPSDTPDDEFIPKSVVVNPYFNWDDDWDVGNLRVPWEETIIYEVHVKGFTRLRMDIGENIRGTYAGLASKNMLSYLKDLGVTTIELMPVQAFIDRKQLVDKGLRNYWGYDPVTFTAVECRYSSSGCNGEQVLEFKRMVNELHNEGFEVILDVVFNHTGEGDHLGPTISFRGLDNIVYYMLNPKDPKLYLDYTGTGNTLNTNHPMVAWMIIEALRYWVQEMHIDGFRFDLAPVLGRVGDNVSFRDTLVEYIARDPILSKVKLIVEPWDLGPNGYQLGLFPKPYSEWNSAYRNTIRRFWRGELIPYKELALRLTGSPDLFLWNSRGPYSSINYITSHDGFTLEDLVSYNTKHNEANSLNNEDGEWENYSWNCGVEGETEDERILACRERQKRNLVITLLVSIGTPMILGGDEIGRTQRGNNNAFCQDNEISWFNWDLDGRRRSFLEFFKEAVRKRRVIPMLKKSLYLEGDDILWLNCRGEKLDDNSWSIGVNCIAYILTDKVKGEKLLVILNGGSDKVLFRVPSGVWTLLLASSRDVEYIIRGGDKIVVDGRTALVYYSS
ncbi:MAG: glycogen debranching protein GlgX [Acidilobaceae archaeon]